VSLKELIQSDKYNIIHSQGFPEAAAARVGVLCLSETANSIVMWGHYSNCHTGFVLGLDGEHPFFNSKSEGITTSNVLRRVEYKKKRPVIRHGQNNGDDHLFVKNEEWAYEKEIRILKDRLLARDKELSLFDLPPEAIYSVIVAAKASDTLKIQLSNLLDRPALRHVRRFKAELDFKEYRININPHASVEMR
jgi:hypothetical protein